MGYPTAPCDSCKAPIIWAETDRGKRMPVDAQPSQNGNLKLVDRPGKPPLARVVKPELAFGAVLYLPHWASCPNASQHRRRRS